MAKATTSFVCRECGYNSPKYLGKCPNCGNWSTMEEFKETTSNAKRPSLVQHSEEAHKTKPMRLDQVSYERVNHRYKIDFLIIFFMYISRHIINIFYSLLI